MGLLDKLLGSDHQLTRPNFDQAPLVELNYSGVKIRYKDAPHSAMSPLVDTLKSLDLNDPAHFRVQKIGNYARLFYSRSWELRGRRGRVVGDVSVRGRLLYFPELPVSGHSCFEPVDFEFELLRFCHDVWGWMNGDAEFGSLGKAKLVYPITREEFDYQQIRSATWCYFTSQRKGDPPQIQFATALTREHILVFDFTLSSYDGIDFYSPETNVKDTCFQVVEDFMSHVHLELPESVKAQQQEDAAGTDKRTQ